LLRGRSLPCCCLPTGPFRICGRQWKLTQSAICARSVRIPHSDGVGRGFRAKAATRIHDDGILPEACEPQPGDQPLVLAFGRLTVDEQSEPFLEGRRRDIELSLLFVEGFGHAGEAECDQASVSGIASNVGGVSNRRSSSASSSPSGNADDGGTPQILAPPRL